MADTDAAPPRPRFLRSDGKEKVTGAGRYTADLTLTGQAFAKFRYADHPHARITRLDTSKARALPGVVAVVTQDDLPDVRFGGLVQDRTLFAKDVVRFEGEIVAGVAALTEEIAAEAARQIEVDYEPLPVVSDFVAAMEPGVPPIHPDLASYEKDENVVADGNTMAYSTIVKGDADAGMAEADLVVRGRYVSDASQGVPIEPRAVVAQWRGDEVTIWSSTQVPYAAREGVAHTLQVPEANVRIVVPLLGGGFGAKCDLHFEAQVAALARAAGRPVKLVFSRREEFTAIAQRREGIVMEFETGVTREGRLVARRAKLVLDKGAYCGEGGFLGQMAAMHACGPYVIEHIFVEAFLNYTNNQPSGSVRAPTAPQVCWGLEQHMDEVARAIEMDPVELRRRSLIEQGAEGPTRQIFDEIGMKRTLERAVEMIGYERELPEDEGIGVAVGWWPCMPASSGAYVHLNGDGSGTIVTGAQENGSGAVMAMPMFVAEELGMRPEDFTILYQDTAAANWDMGSCGSQTTFNSGRAILAAAADVREQLLDAAAEELEVDRQDLELADGTVRVKGSPDRSVSVGDLAGAGTIHGKGSGDVPEVPGGDTGGCVGRLGNETFLAPQLITQAAHVKVDRATGVVRVLKVAAAHDSGMILNRSGADGQVTGGVVMGVGLALSEGTQLDDEGRQRNPALLDYKLVTSADTPEIEVDWIQVPAKGAGPRGSKGVGEPPQVPTAAAIANAIASVVGTQVRQLPMTPERVWAASRGAGA
ncbi:MAG TPA: xanthine dehydrogenase family protein molybdopterin-binding subunit [Actinomycetota bacterium]|nr:xanthine dehydrogenase family protein molybdopterin-binding subunit [Actinomycetota bacterium]